MSEHNTGPWKVDVMENVGENWLIADCGQDSDGQHYIVTTDHVHASEMMGDTKGDALLMAASPDLLEACLAVIGHGYLENRHPASQDFVSKSAIAKARTAISKAKGGHHG